MDKGMVKQSHQFTEGDWINWLFTGRWYEVLGTVTTSAGWTYLKLKGEPKEFVIRSGIEHPYRW